MFFLICNYLFLCVFMFYYYYLYCLYIVFYFFIFFHIFSYIFIFFHYVLLFFPMLEPAVVSILLVRVLALTNENGFNMSQDMSFHVFFFLLFFKPCLKSLFRLSWRKDRTPGSSWPHRSPKEVRDPRWAAECCLKQRERGVNRDRLDPPRASLTYNWPEVSLRFN